MRAWLNLRYTVPARRAAFESGLQRLGYRVVDGMPDDVGEKDIFVTWNRIRYANTVAQRFEDAVRPVLVTENACWGNEFAGDRWYTIARNRHNTAGLFPVGDNARWDDLGIDLSEWRAEGETVILPQRGIGSAPTAMPARWLSQITETGRVRSHPGTKNGIPLEQDLANCGRVVTWGSGAAIKALMMGIPVTSYMPNWIGEQNNTDAGRLDMLRRLAWAQHRHSEIESGEAFVRLMEWK